MDNIAAAANSMPAHPPASGARLPLAAAIVLTTLVAAARVDACGCAEIGPPCQALWQSSTVFMGRVVDVAPVELPGGGPERTEGRARIQVVETFRGSAGRDVDVFTGPIGNTCAYNFEVGQTYLVYAFEGGGRLSTGNCSRTRRVSEAAEDLAYLRTYASKPSALGTIQGIGQRMDDLLDGGFPVQTPFEGAVVVASSGDRRYEARTGRDGIYQMRVPPGRYQVDFKVPEGLYALTPGRIVEVHDTRGCAAADVDILEDGRILGRVVDGRGSPVAGLTMEAEVLDNQLGVPDQDVLTDEQGMFELTRLPRGRYVISIGRESRDAPAGSRIFHPGVIDASAATQIELGSSERVTMTDLVLPAATRIVPVSGTVRDRAGRPIASVKVYVMHADGRAIAAGPATTDRNGRFQLSVPTGRYRITADLRAPASMKLRKSQELPPFEASSRLAPFDITLPD